MRNKNLILKKIKDLSYDLGCWDNGLEKLSIKELNKVIDNIDQEYTDVEVKIRNKDYIVEIGTVDNEKDFCLKSKLEYINQYGLRDN